MADKQGPLWEKMHNKIVKTRQRVRYQAHGGVKRGPSWEKEHNRMVKARQRIRYKNGAPKKRVPTIPTVRL